MATKQLSDLDGRLAQLTLGSEIVGDGSTAIATDGYYLVTSVASSASTLPTGATIGYPVFLTTTITPVSGDNVKAMAFADLCFVQNFSASFTKDELETTTLCDSIKTYLTGRSDLTGTFDGVYTAGNAVIKSLINRFVDTATQLADNSAITISAANSDLMYLQLSVNRDSTNGEPEQYYLLPVTITTTTAGVSQGSAQTFSSGFRVTTDGVNNVRPVFFELEQPAV